MRLYVGNIDYRATKDDLQCLFKTYGSVQSTIFPTDRDTGRQRSFGFVEMQNDHEAERAIMGLNGKELHGRALTVNEARLRQRSEVGLPTYPQRTAVDLDRKFGPLRVRMPQW
jgi:cold-inducible RNA-binding protein